LYRTLRDVAIEKGVETITGDLNRTDQNLTEMSRKCREISDTPEFSETLTDADVRAADELDNELAHLTKRIEDVHTNCFGSTGSIPAMLMLERVENALEGLYRQLACVKPQFADATQRKKDEERLEKLRLTLAEKKAAEQKLKFDQALERAQMPIKKRTGRPPLRRMLPIPMNRKDPEQSRAEQLERERLEKLLYRSDSAE
jgi:hypothetical protein